MPRMQLVQGGWSRRLLAPVVALIFAVLGVLWNQTILARKVIGPPPLEQVATTWIGLSEDELYFFRIVLNLESMNGKIGFVFTGGDPRVFDVSTWAYESGEIKISTHFPPGSESWEGSLRGSVSPQGMKLKMAGRGWSRFLFLRQEAVLEQSWQALKNAMEHRDRKKD